MESQQQKNKLVFFVSYNGWKLTESQVGKRFRRRGKVALLSNCIMSEIPLKNTYKPTCKYSALRQQIEISPELHLPVHLSNFEVSIVGTRGLDGLGFKYSMSIKRGNQTVVEREYNTMKQWEFLNIRKNIILEEANSRYNADTKYMENLKEPSIDDFKFSLSYINGRIHFEDPLGKGVWQNEVFGKDLESNLESRFLSRKTVLNDLFGDLAQLATYISTCREYKHIAHLIDMKELDYQVQLLNKFKSLNKEFGSDDIGIKNFHSAIPSNLLTNGEGFLKSLCLDNANKEIRDLLSNLKDRKDRLISDFLNPQDLLKNASSPYEMPQNLKDDAAADGYIWRICRCFNTEISKICDLFLNQLLNKTIVNITGPLTTPKNLLFEEIYEEKNENHHFQLMRSKDEKEPGGLHFVVYDSTNKLKRILFWNKLSSSSPPKCFYAALPNQLIYLKSDTNDPARAFELKSLTYKNISSSTIHLSPTLNLNEEQLDSNTNGFMALSSLGSKFAVINHKNELNYYKGVPKDDLIKKAVISSPTKKWELGKQYPPRESIGFLHFVNDNLIVSVFFNEFCFKSFLLDVDETEVMAKHECIFDAAVDQKKKSNKSSSLSQNSPHPYHYPIATTLSVGVLLLLPYKHLDFEIVFVCPQARQFVIGTRVKADKAIFLKYFPDSTVELKQNSARPNYMSYFSLDQADEGVINIVVVKKKHDSTEIEEKVHYLRCILRL